MPQGALQEEPAETPPAMGFRDNQEDNLAVKPDVASLEQEAVGLVYDVHVLQEAVGACEAPQGASE